MEGSRKVPGAAAEAEGEEAMGQAPADSRTAAAQLLKEGDHWLLRESIADSGTPATTGLVPALDKAIRIIGLLNKSGPEELALAQIAARAGISKSHCHGLLKTLVAHDWLAFNPRLKTYRLQTGILRDTSSILVRSNELSYVRPVLDRLAHTVGIPVVLSQPLVDGSFVVVDKFSIQHALEISFPVGTRFAREAAAQMRANLAWRPPDEIDRWFASWEPKKYSSRSLVSEDEIRSEIIKTRERGYARSVGEFTEGVMALALPIFGRDGIPCFIFNCTSLISIFEKREQDVSREMLSAAHEIHEALGSSVPSDFKF